MENIKKSKLCPLTGKIKGSKKKEDILYDHACVRESESACMSLWYDGSIFLLLKELKRDNDIVKNDNNSGCYAMCGM